MEQNANECTFENCANEVVARCVECQLNYCVDHASEVDPLKFCINCLVPEDAAVVESPLVDADGVTHKGRIITPVGKAYRLAAKMVFEMSDEELEDYIKTETKTVRDIENIREYHMTSLGSAHAEQYRRELGTLAKVGGVLRVGTSSQRVPAIRGSNSTNKTPAPKASKVSKAADLISQLSPEDLTTLLKSFAK